MVLIQQVVIIEIGNVRVVVLMDIHIETEDHIVQIVREMFGIILLLQNVMHVNEVLGVMVLVINILNVKEDIF